MATNYPTSVASPTYCQVTDVARVLNKDKNYFTTSTVPNSESVKEYILESEEQVDDDTGRSWRSRTVTNEYHDIDKNAQYKAGVGLRLKLNHRFVKTLDSGSNDKLEVWNGTQYIDYLTSKTEGRNNDFWLDYENGILYLREYVFLYKEKAVRITYRYGETTVPKNVQQATAVWTAYLILLNEDRSFILSETGETRNMGYDQRVSAYQRRYKQILQPKADFFVV